MKRPAMKYRRETAHILSEKLDERHYQEAPDALGMMDLTPQALGVAPDSIRVMLAKTLSIGPSAGNTYVGGNQYEDRLPGARLGRGRPYAVMISSAIDNLARLFVAILASLFLLAPMIILTYVSSQTYHLVITCLFVLAFAVTASVASNASNQELMAASAAYAAVLVVFVGQTTPSVGNTGATTH